MIGVRAEDSRFRPYWWGTDLPPVPFELRGDLDWLAAQPAHEQWTIHGNATAELLELLGRCRRAGVPLPPSFTQFMSSSTLQDRRMSG
jgi:hypothetical protein